MASVFRFLVKSMNVCCPAEYIRLTRRILPQRLADYLGIHVRTLRSWRRRVESGKEQCKRSHNCAKLCPDRPDVVVIPRRRRSSGQSPQKDS